LDRERAAAPGKGYVTRFRVAKELLSNYAAHEAGGKACREYWIPADDLAGLNAALVGGIEVIAEFKAPTADFVLMESLKPPASSAREYFRPHPEEGALLGGRLEGWQQARPS
jgi:hypothetical protein